MLSRKLYKTNSLHCVVLLPSNNDFIRLRIFYYSQSILEVLNYNWSVTKVVDAVPWIEFTNYLSGKRSVPVDRRLDQSETNI